MRRLFYRGYVIQLLRQGGQRYVAHLFPHDQDDAQANRARPYTAYLQDSRLPSEDGPVRFFTTVTEAVEAAIASLTSSVQQIALPIVDVAP
jgi:DNA-binding LacI/PurR family transcriptional regulator